MRSEIVFRTRRKPLVGEILAQAETHIDVRHVDREGKYRVTRIERTEIREVRNLLFDLPPVQETRRGA